MMTSLRGRQWRTTVLLVLCLITLTVAGRWQLRRAETADAQTTSTEPTAADEVLAAMDAQTELPAAALYRPDDGQGAIRAELIFRGTADETTMTACVRAMTAHGLTPRVFVTAQQAQGAGSGLANVRSEGAAIGGYVLTVPADDAVLVRALCALSEAITRCVGAAPTLLMTDTAPDERLLRIAGACGFDTVMTPDTSAVDVGDAAAWLSALPRGSLAVMPLVNGCGDAAGVLADALVNSSPSARAGDLMMDNGGRMAEVQTRVYTVEAHVAFTFSGLTDAAMVRAVLTTLKAQDSTAMFFATMEEAAQRPDVIRMIMDAGQEVGILAEAGADARQMLTALETERELLKEAGVTEAVTVVRASGQVTDALKQAASAGGYTLVSAMTEAVRASDGVEDAEAAFARIFPEGSDVLQRGQIVHFHMNGARRADALCGLIRLILTQQSLYPSAGLASMLANEADRWNYPVDAADVRPELRDRIRAGQLNGGTLTAIQQRYIGAGWVSTENMLPGFTRKEITTLDKTGMAARDERVAFLTFDDWGTDRAITPLLAVLAKHGVKATFFVRTENVHYNPNLLRAIAAQGHAIACHTHTHLTLADDTDGRGRVYTELTAEEADALQADLLLSWQTLTDICGDVVVEDVSSLTTLFRPPTLAVSRIGLETVLDCGFSYVVSGSCSTQDYSAKSVDALVQKLRLGTAPGAILVMHMSDNSIWTAEALDKYLTQQELLPAARRLRFIRLDEVLR